MLARWKQTLIAAIGVTFSITMFIALLGFMYGLNDLLDGLILNRTPHVRLFNEITINENQPVNNADGYKNAHNFIHSIKPVSGRQSIYNSEAILNAIRKDPRVLGVSPKIVAQVFFNAGTIEITGVINGIDAYAESRMFNFNDYVTEGVPQDIMTVTNSIILGRALADNLRVNLGDIVQVITPSGRRFSLKVVGYFESGMQDFDKTLSYASLTTTQKLLGQANSYLTDIQVKLHNIERAPDISKEYGSIFETQTEDVQTVNSDFETGSFIRSLISYVVGVTLLIVAGFGIYNILNMMIYEKMDSIAILKATGFSGSDVKQIFIVLALSIGISGGLAGLVFGFIVSAGIDQLPFQTDSLPKVTTFPVSYAFTYYLIGITFAIITTYLAGLLPAAKASHIDPVIIIRGK